MDIVEINYIDTSELDRYIHESLKRWRDTAAPFAVTINILTKRIWRNDVKTNAVFYCQLEPHSAYNRPLLIVYVEYDEVNMTGKIELESVDLESEVSKNLIDSFKGVFISFDPATAPLPFGVKCPHCGAKYVYKTSTGTVNCQNCAKPFDLEYQEEIPLSEPDAARVGSVRELGSRYIALDRSKITHCKWCGTVESPNWKSSRDGKIYCSNDCLLADSLEMNALGGFCTIILPFFLLFPFIGFSSSFFVGMIPIYGIFWITSLVFFFLALKGNNTRASRPRNSRKPM